MILKRLTLDEWKLMSKKAHQICFGEDQDPEILTCDYALIAVNDNDELLGYATIVEINKISAYMQHGGIMPNSQGSTIPLMVYRAVTGYLKEHYHRISTRILNTNIAMIKISMAQGLIINGTDFIEGELFLNLLWSGGVVV